MILEQAGDEFNIKNQEQRSPGRILQEARQAKNINITDAANELRLSTARLTSLEENKFADMGAVTFAKGYLRSYARFLGVSEEEVLQAFETLNLASDIPSYKPSLMNEKMGEGSVGGGVRSARRMTYLVGLIVAVLLILWWHNRENIAQSFLRMTSPAAQAVSLNNEEESVTVRDDLSERPTADGEAKPLSSLNGVETYALPAQPAEQQPSTSQSEVAAPEPKPAMTAKSAPVASSSPEPVFDEHAEE
jgi:cytoskeleton protein RodZ